MMKNFKIIIGWITFAITLIITSLWSYWGANEAFHEGWYHTSLWQNLAMTFVQYLSIPIIFLTLSLIAINYKKIGLGLFMVLGIFALFFFDSNAGRIMIFIPLLLLATGFHYGKFQHTKIIISLLITIPFLIILSFGIPQLIRVVNRHNDHDFGTRIIIGNNIKLTWAPQGIGFPLEGTNWQTAKDNCALLNEEGTGLKNHEVDTWRLPTRDEIVRSLTRNNENVTGFMDDTGVAQYETTPDKETPLWNPHSKVIYYWTVESKDEKKAYLVAYNGYVLVRSKDSGAAYQGYRCVREMENIEEEAATIQVPKEDLPIIKKLKLKATDCLSEQRNVDACIEIYQPVCGQVQVECIKAPCDPIKETFGNSCKACMNPRVLSYTEGECFESDDVKR